MKKIFLINYLQKQKTLGPSDRTVCHTLKTRVRGYFYFHRSKGKTGICQRQTGAGLTPHPASERAGPEGHKN